MFYLFAKFIQTFTFNIIYLINRKWLSLLGVRLGKNLKTFFISTIENPKGINIGIIVWIREKAIILKSVNAGNGCVIGAESAVTKDIPPFSVVAGNPAKIIKVRK